MPRPRKWSVQGHVYAPRKPNLTWHLPFPEPVDLDELSDELAGQLALEAAGPDIPAAPVLGIYHSPEEAPRENNSCKGGCESQELCTCCGCAAETKELCTCHYSKSFPVELSLPGSTAYGERVQHWYTRLGADNLYHSRLHWIVQYRLHQPAPFRVEADNRENYLLTTEVPERIPRSLTAAKLVRTRGRSRYTLYFRVENIAFPNGEVAYRCGQCLQEGLGHQQVVHHQQHAHVDIRIDWLAKLPDTRIQFVYIDNNSKRYTILPHINGRNGGPWTLECPMCGWTTTQLTGAIIAAHIRRRHIRSVAATLVGTVTSQYAREVANEKACHARIVHEGRRKGVAPPAATIACSVENQVELYWQVPDETASFLPRRYRGESYSQDPLLEDGRKLWLLRTDCNYVRP